MTISIPNISWYLATSQMMGVSPRCPFATVETCPRFYQSLSLLGNAGSTSIESSEDNRLLKKWKTSDLWPKTREQETIIYGNNKIFDNFCPEVTFERFGYFASCLCRYSDELDHDLAHKQLGEIGASSEDYRWAWSSVTAMHFTECPIYSVLLFRQNDKENRINQKELPHSIDSQVIYTVDKSLAQKNKWKECWRNLSAKVKVFVISVTAIVALIAAFLTNVEKIEEFIKIKTHSASVPNIIVKLSNSSEKEVIVSARGDFTLWLPGPGAYHNMGKYEFITTEGKPPTEGSFVVPPKKIVNVYAKIMNQIYYAKILSQSDCDLSLLIYRSNAGLTYTNQIPFTKEAIMKYYVEADVGK